MTRLRLRWVREEGQPAYQTAPAWLRRRLAVWRQRWDRRRDLDKEMRTQRASVQVSVAGDMPGNYLLPGTAWRGPMSSLPRPLRRKTRQALIAYYCLHPRISTDYPWTPLPGDPRSRTVDVREARGG